MNQAMNTTNGASRTPVSVEVLRCLDQLTSSNLTEPLTTNGSLLILVSSHYRDVCQC